MVGDSATIEGKKRKKNNEIIEINKKKKERTKKYNYGCI